MSGKAHKLHLWPGVSTPALLISCGVIVAAQAASRFSYISHGLENISAPVKFSQVTPAGIPLRFIGAQEMAAWLSPYMEAVQSTYLAPLEKEISEVHFDASAPAPIPVPEQKPVQTVHLHPPKPVRPARIEAANKPSSKYVQMAHLHHEKHVRSAHAEAAKYEKKPVQTAHLHPSRQVRPAQDVATNDTVQDLVQEEKLIETAQVQAPQNTVRDLAQEEKLAQTAQYTEVSAPPTLAGKKYSDPVQLAASAVSYDGSRALAKATGRVEVIEGDTILSADEVTYDQDTGRVRAAGHVALAAPSGEVYFADDAVLKNNMQQGVIRQFKAKLKGNSLFASRETYNASQQMARLEDAAYSPQGKKRLPADVADTTAPVGRNRRGVARVEPVLAQQEARNNDIPEPVLVRSVAVVPVSMAANSVPVAAFIPMAPDAPTSPLAPFPVADRIQRPPDKSPAHITPVETILASQTAPPPVTNGGHMQFASNEQLPWLAHAMPAQKTLSNPGHTQLASEAQVPWFTNAISAANTQPAHASSHEVAQSAPIVPVSVTALAPVADGEHMQLASYKAATAAVPFDTVAKADGQAGSVQVAQADLTSADSAKNFAVLAPAAGYTGSTPPLAPLPLISPSLLPPSAHQTAAPDVNAFEPESSALSAQSKAIADTLPPEKIKKVKTTPIKMDHSQANPLENEDVRKHEGVGISISVRKPKFNANQMLEAAYDALIAGNQQEAITTYKEVLDQDSGNKLALLGLATTYHRAGQLQLARPLYGKLLAIDPLNTEGLNNFLVLLADESPKEALEEMKKLEFSHPNFSPLPAQMAVIYEKMGNYDEAIKNMNHAIDLSPENLKYRLDMAVMLDKGGDWAHAATYYQQLLTASERGEKIPASPEEIQERLTFIRSNVPKA